MGNRASGTKTSTHMGCSHCSHKLCLLYHRISPCTILSMPFQQCRPRLTQANFPVPILPPSNSGFLDFCSITIWGLRTPCEGCVMPGHDNLCWFCWYTHYSQDKVLTASFTRCLRKDTNICTHLPRRCLISVPFSQMPTFQAPHTVL